MSEVGYTVSTNSNASGRNTPIVLVLNDQGGGVMSVSYDVTSTLRSQTKHHEPVVLVYDARGNGGGCSMPNNHRRTSEPGDGLHSNRVLCFTPAQHGVYAEGLGTLRASGGDIGGGSEVLIIEKHVSEIRIHEDICPTLGERLGTGGGNFPMIVDTLVFDEAQITSKLNYSHPTWGGNAIPSQAQPDKP